MAVEEALPAAAGEIEHAGTLRSAGLRVTRPRLLVLGALHGRPGHISADEIADLLRDAGTPLPRASVYNVTADLVNHGLLMFVGGGPGRTLFEITKERHDHFVCWQCDTITDVSVGVPMPSDVHAALPGAEIDETVTLVGRCPDCVRTSERPARRRPRPLRRRDQR